MWKYQCKKHLLSVLLAGVIGAFLFQLNGYGNEIVVELSEMLNQPELLEIKYLSYALGACTLAGMVNGLLILNYVVQRFNISSIFLFMIIMIGFIPVVNVGVFTLPIAIIVCIYGMITIPNRKEKSEMRRNGTTVVKEIERVYRLHHKYYEEYEELANKVWYANIKATLSYIVGFLVVILVMLMIDSFVILLLSMMAFGMLYTYMSRQKAMAAQPIIALLYDQCNPEACASCIFALNHKFRKKNNFVLPQYLAQAMIYLNDPHLAADIMVTCEHDKGALKFPYYTIMAYAYYQLGDRSMVEHEYLSCENVQVNPNTPLAVLKTQCVAGIKNKLDLMDRNFTKVQEFFNKNIESSVFECQRVDSHYYLGLISFVNRDFDDARYHFNYVQQHGNTMYFKEKANKFLETIAQSDSTCCD